MCSTRRQRLTNGLARPSSNESEDNIVHRMNNMHLDDMTSREFYSDVDAYIRTQELYIRNNDYTKTFIQIISENKHLFRDKVSTNLKFKHNISA